eukprot:Skav212590  [mRNA]  locus=scaffold125:530151:534734:+ [translate_table: standard]
MRATSLGSIGGKQVGSAFLTNVPSRPLMHKCPLEVWKQSRITFNTFLVHQHWIHGANYYGRAFRAETTEVREQTDSDLRIITERIVHGLRGKRFITGDFNQQSHHLPETKIWESLGWKEIQILEKEQHGTDIRMTCKGKTRKDYVWISPELAKHFQSVVFHTDIFKDHAVLGAKFRPFGKPEPIPIWRQPKSLDWEHLQKLPEGNFQLSSLPSHVDPCLAIANEFEQRLVQSAAADKPILPCQLGRSRTTQPKAKPEYTKPVTRSRAGHLQPEYHGTSLRYNQWFKQLRRLEAFARTSATVRTVQQQTHRFREWRAILRAPGFGPSFQNWWSTQPRAHNLIPTTLPDLPITQESAVALRDVFAAEVRAFEKILVSELTSKATANRLSNPYKVFQDVKKEKVSPVQLLDYSKSTTVVNVCEEEMAVEVSPPVTFSPNHNIHTTEGPIQPIHLEPDKIWVKTIDNLHEGDTLQQDILIGQLTDMFEKFGTEWQTRWNKHSDTPESRWDPMMRFIEEHVPQRPVMTYRPITYEQWTHNLQRKKKHSATGPDGWGRSDVLNLPRDLVQGILDLFFAIENGLPWPQSLLNGVIHALEKTKQASTVGDYRPITVFPIMYRNWSSLRSKECLEHFLAQAPTTCRGNLPGRTAQDVWFMIQLRLEEHHFTGTQLSGCMLDLVKCFNHLPRTVLLAMCIRLGMPDQIVRTWCKALQGMSRRFMIRGGTGPPLTSTTGYPEGCGLSVVAMCAANILVDHWMQAHSPRTQIITYVDNWELLAEDESDLLHGYLSIESFCQHMDILLDDKKTFFWSTKPEVRKSFREQNKKIQSFSRDLGGHVQYTRQITNAVITQKIEAFQPRWALFARTSAPRPQKLQAITSVAFPNIFHAISSVHLGDLHHEHVRTAIVRCLKDNAPGTSPPMVLSLFEHPKHDPGFYALWHTILDFRHYTNPETSAMILEALSIPDRKRPKPGPCSVLLERLHGIGWFWEDGGFHDQWGVPVSLWDAPIQELRFRTVEAWQQSVAQSLAHRKTFTGIQNIHALLSTENLPIESAERTTLRRNMTGTFVTADHLVHRDTTETGACKLCGRPDSIEHRIWHCSKLDTARQTLPADHRQQLETMDDITRLHGWVQRPPSLLKLRNHLTSLADDTDKFHIPHGLPKILNIFTDGSCHNPDDKYARIASWGVATSLRDTTFHAVAAGLVPGFLQTINRAELLALIAAFEFAHTIGRPFHVWTDSKYVFRLVHRIRCQPGWGPKRNWANHDLVERLISAYHQVSGFCLGVHKVFSHQDMSKLDGLEQWICQGNEAADNIAAGVFLNNPTTLNLSDQLHTEILQLRRQRDWIQRTMIATGSLAIELQNHQEPTDEPTEPIYSPPAMHNWLFPVELPPTAHTFEHEEWGDITAWIRSLHGTEARDRVYRWSWFQLYTDFVLQYEHEGPWYDTTSLRWRASSSMPGQPNFVRRSRWFTSYLRKVAGHLQIQLPVVYGKPDSPLIGYWLNLLPVSVSADRHAAVNEWMVQWNNNYMISKDLAVIP